MSEAIETRAPLAELAVSLLMHGRIERYEYDAGGLAVIDGAVRALVETKLPQRQAMLELASVAYTLEKQLQSPSAGRAIIRLLTRVPGIGRLLPELEPTRAQNVWRSMTGERTPLSRTPEARADTIKLKAVFTPAVRRG